LLSRTQSRPTVAYVRPGLYINTPIRLTSAIVEDISELISSLKCQQML